MTEIRVQTLVDSAAFEQFFELFGKYQAAFNQHAGKWEEVAKASRETHVNWKEAAKAVHDLADKMDSVLTAATGVGGASVRVANRWQYIARYTREAAGSIGTATASLLKWASITGIITGLTGFGGIWGLDNLAHGVGATRSSAMGLGTSYGTLQAFRANYGRLGDPDSFLSRVAESQSDVSKRLPYNALGISQGDVTGKDTGSLAIEVINKFKEWVDHVPREVLSNYLENTHLNELFSLQEAQLYNEMKPGEVEQVTGQIEKDRSAFNLTGQTQKRWQDLSTQLDRSAIEIKSAFIDRLVDLEPGLEKLSGAVVELADQLLAKNGPVSQWLGDLNQGLEWLAKHLDDPETAGAVNDWIGKVTTAAGYLATIGKDAFELMHFFARIVGGGGGGGGKSDGKDVAGAAGVVKQNEKAETPGAATTPGSGRSLLDQYRARGASMFGGGTSPGSHRFRSTLGHWWSDERIKHAVDRLKAGGMPEVSAEALVARWAYIEAPGGPDSVNPSGHRGIAQWDAHRWSNVGGDRGFDAQLDAVNAETRIGGEEKIAGGILRQAHTPHEAAVGQSSYERAEGFSTRTQTDAYTDNVEKLIPRVHDIYTGKKAEHPTPKATSTTVTINKNPGANPATSSAASAAPP